MSESDKVIGGWEQRGQVGLFYGAKTFDDILELIRSAVPGSLIDSSGNEIDASKIVKIKAAAEKGQLVAGGTIGEITRNYGLREAVVRAMAPDFLQVSGGRLDYIIQWLQHIKTQQDGLEGVQSGSGKPLTILSDSSGSPVDLDFYIKALNDVSNKISQNLGQPSYVDDAFYMQFTGSNGLREAIMKALRRI